MGLRALTVEEIAVLKAIVAQRYSCCNGDIFKYDYAMTNRLRERRASWTA